MYGTPSCSRKSKTVTMFGWFSEPATRASRMNRCASDGSPVRTGAPLPTSVQAKRTTSLYAEGEYDWKRAGGWTPKEIYSHLAAVAGVVPQMGGALSSMPDGADIVAGMDINAMNAQAVGGMASMSFPQVMEAFETNYRKLIDYVRELPDDLLNQKRRFFTEPIPVSDILSNILVLHGLHHVYEANNRFESPV